MKFSYFNAKRQNMNLAHEGAIDYKDALVMLELLLAIESA